MPGVVVPPGAALPDMLVDHDSSLDFMTPDAVLERPVSEDKAEYSPEEQQLQVFMTDAVLEEQPQQQPVMEGAQMLAEKPQQAMCGVTEEQVEVMVYNILTKLASDCGNGPQHISCNVVSRISDVSRL